jgi:elongation factor 2
MHGMGELHLEVIENRIRTEKKVDVQTSPPIVVYRETIVGTTPQAAEGKSPNKHNKFYFTVEPVDEKITEFIKKGDIPNARLKKKEQELWEVLEKAGMKTIESRAVREVYNGNLLLDKTKGEVHIGEVIELVMDGFEQVMEKGSLAREPCMKVKVNLLDIKLHEDAIHRGPAQVLPAVRDGIRDAIFNAKPLMLEPVQVLDFEAPIDFMGNVSKLIQNKRGQLLDAQQEGEMIKIKAKMPVAEMFGMTSELRSATEGRATFFLVDQSFERLPDELQGKIIQQIRKRKGLTENQ